jgi:hypothetical protein
MRLSRFTRAVASSGVRFFVFSAQQQHFSSMFPSS